MTEDPSHCPECGNIWKDCVCDESDDDDEGFDEMDYDDDDDESDDESDDDFDDVANGEAYWIPGDVIR